MYGMFTYIYHKFRQNAGKYSIHGASGIGKYTIFPWGIRHGSRDVSKHRFTPARFVISWRALVCPRLKQPMKLLEQSVCRKLRMLLKATTEAHHPSQLTHRGLVAWWIWEFSCRAGRVTQSVCGMAITANSIRTKCCWRVSTVCKMWVQSPTSRASHFLRFHAPRLHFPFWIALSFHPKSGKAPSLLGCPRKIGSMVRINGLFHLLISGVYISSWPLVGNEGINPQYTNVKGFIPSFPTSRASQILGWNHPLILTSWDIQVHFHLSPPKTEAQQSHQHQRGGRRQRPGGVDAIRHVTDGLGMGWWGGGYIIRKMVVLVPLGWRAPCCLTPQKAL